LVYGFGLLPTGDFPFAFVWLEVSDATPSIFWPVQQKQWRIHRLGFIVFAMHSTPPLADAILPSLVLVWPVLILLLIPIIVVEALYSRRRLGMQLWECLRVVGVANILSSVAGLPIGHILAAGLQYAAEGTYFRDPDRLRTPLLGSVEPLSTSKHDYARLVFLGLYPRWILLLSAAAMLVICFLISWWVEAKWIQRYLKRMGQSDEPATATVWRTVRNANVASYSLVSLLAVWLLTWLWPTR
jgi:hypothetical protein